MRPSLIPTTLSVLFLFSGAPSHAAEPLLARLADQHDPPVRVLLHLERAQALAAEGDFERALDQVTRGLSLSRESGASDYDKARLELWAIQWREREVMRCIAAAQLDEARDLLLRMSEPLVSPFSLQRLTSLEAALDDAEVEARRGNNGKLDRDALRVQRRIDAGTRLLDRADAELGKSRAKTHLTVYSARRAQSALRHSQEVQRSVTRWLRSAKTDRSKEMLLALQLRAVDSSVEAMLQIAEARTTQGDFREALSWVGQVLQQSPKNEQARELRRTIQVATAASAGWLGVGGPGLGAPQR